MHRRVGEAIEAAQGRRQERYLTELALHFTRAVGCRGRREGDHLRLPRRRAGDHDAGARGGGRALRACAGRAGRFQPEASERRCELLLRLGEACVRGGERPSGPRRFLEAAALAERLGDGASLARAAIGASRRYVQQPGVVDTELIAMLERALELEPGRVGRSGAAARVAVRRALLLARARPDARAQRRGDRDRRRAGRSRGAGYACAARRRALWDPSHLSERVEVSTQMLTLARQAGNMELQLAGARLARRRPARARRSRCGGCPDRRVHGRRRAAPPAAVRWNAMVWRAMRALLDGRSSGRGAAAEALAAGAPGRR